MRHHAVLRDHDDLHDPIGNAVRGILDGHIWLSRRMASRGHFPAIDVLESVSRVMPEVVDEDHRTAAQEIKEDLARAREVEDLVQLGAYVRGQDVRTDGALDRLPAIEALLRQRPDELSPRDEAIASMHAVKTPRRRAAPARNTGNFPPAGAPAGSLPATAEGSPS